MAVYGQCTRVHDPCTRRNTAVYMARTRRVQGPYTRSVHGRDKCTGSVPVLCTQTVYRCTRPCTGRDTAVYAKQ